ncbi:MAG: hypothetical protein OCC49_18225 [Fibrobacterales bacterium]
MILLEPIEDYTIPFDEWHQKYLFLDTNTIPPHHRDLIKPLSKSYGTNALKDLRAFGVFKETPLNKLFSFSISKSTQDASAKAIGKWLFKRGIPFNLTVHVIWESGESALVPWKVLAHYHNLFFTQKEAVFCIAESIEWGTIKYSHPIIECAHNTRYSLDK